MERLAVRIIGLMVFLAYASYLICELPFLKPITPSLERVYRTIAGISRSTRILLVHDICPCKAQEFGVLGCLTPSCLVRGASVFDPFGIVQEEVSRGEV